MSQDMPPRADGSSADADAVDPTRTGGQAPPPTVYSAPSPADRPTSSVADGEGAGHPYTTGASGPAQGDSGSTGTGWRADMDRDTGPVPVQSAQNDQGWWRPRPSGAWSAPTWGDAPQAGEQPTGRPGAARTQSFPSGSFPAGSTGTYPGYPGQRFGPATHAAAATATPESKPTKGHRGSVLVATTTIVALLAGFGGGLLGSQLASSSGSSADSSLTQLSTSAPVADRSPAPAGSIQAVAAKVLPSTVSVLASSSTSGGEGSGIILTADGLILTNNHVVEGATDLQVRFNDGTTAGAQVVGTDSTDDLAVIKAQGVSGLTPATLGSSASLQVGQPVVAIGSPLGLSATVTSGIVSALNRPVRTSSAEQTQSGQSGQDTVMNAVQTDAAINPGNSGGALVDMSGAVIGINSAIASLSSGSDGQAGSIGVGFAIPIDQAKRIAQEIIDTGKASHAVLGASVGDSTNGNSAIPSGAKIAEITPGSGAEAAGLQAGDIITKVGDQPVESSDALIAAIRSAQPNGKTTITYTRGSDTQTITVTLGSATAN